MGTPLELLYAAKFEGPPIFSVASKVDQWAGQTDLPTGSVTVTVSTTAVLATDQFQIGLSAVGDVASRTGQPIEVKSISAGNFVMFGTMDGEAFDRDTTIMWNIVRTG